MSASRASRRHFFGQVGGVLSWASLAALMGAAVEAGPAGAQPVGLPNFTPRAKRAISLFMSGAPPQMDLLDYKPKLAAYFDTDLPDSVRGSQALTGMTAGQSRFPIAPSYWKFAQYGASGRWVSDLLPWTSRMIDELTLIHTVNTDAINHEPSCS
jgi:hypothetical protein